MMFCPYCGNPCSETHKFCFRCGKPLPELTNTDPVVKVSAETVQPVDTPAVYPAQPYLTDAASPDPIPGENDSTAEPSLPQKMGRLWPPLAALLVMICVGLSAFFLAPRDLPQEPPKTCFMADNGVLLFEYSLYTGSDELVIPGTVDDIAITAISENCFADCDRLTTVILPETVTVIGSNAFAGCDSLRGIYIHDGVLSIGSGAFSNCPALEAVYIPGSVTEIGESCFDNCTGLQFIFFDGTYSQWRQLYNGSFQDNVKLYTRDGAYQLQP